MSRTAALVWIPFGFIVSIIDCWLSIQSMFGMMNPANFMGYSAAVVVGVALTAFAIGAPIVRQAHSSVVFLFCWLLLVILDIGTSVIGAIWYGLLKHPLNSRIDIAGLRFDPGNWMNTAAFVAFVLIVAWCCVRFGKALKTLSQPEPQEHKPWFRR
jgi:hypothetical protein